MQTAQIRSVLPIFTPKCQVVLQKQFFMLPVRNAEMDASMQNAVVGCQGQWCVRTSSIEEDGLSKLQKFLQVAFCKLRLLNCF